jgi:hypothetical protein
MQNISNSDLDTVFGGTTPPSPTPTHSTGSGSGGCNDQLLTALQGIQSSIKDIGKHNNNGGLFGGNGMLFLGMALAMQRRNDTVVCVGGGYHNYGYSYRSTWY